MKPTPRWIFLNILSGLLSGLAAWIFLVSLNWVTHFRENHPGIVWGLPLAGLLIGWLYFRFGRDSQAGHGLILDEIHDPKKILPVAMAPLIWITTLLTHLFGGSAGREGAAVQMGASLSDQLCHFFKIESHERKILLAAGMSGGFGAAIGAPWAGAIFGMEVIYVGRFRMFALIECFIASFVAFYTASALGAPHSQFPRFEIPALDLNTMIAAALSGVVFGLGARAFVLATHAVETLQQKFVKFSPLRPFLGGLAVLVCFWYIDGSSQYLGLGIPVIQKALTEPASWSMPLLKTLLTALTVGSGFKGGEFVPLVFIGTSLGSALSVFFPGLFPLLGALGFAAVFGAAAKTPIACSLMAMEIFGPRIAPFALAACCLSSFVAGRRRIYNRQSRNG